MIFFLRYLNLGWGFVNNSWQNLEDERRRERESDYVAFLLSILKILKNGGHNEKYLTGWRKLETTRRSRMNANQRFLIHHFIFLSSFFLLLSPQIRQCRQRPCRATASTTARSVPICSSEPAKSLRE